MLAVVLPLLRGQQCPCDDAPVEQDVFVLGRNLSAPDKPALCITTLDTHVLEKLRVTLQVPVHSITNSISRHEILELCSVVMNVTSLISLPSAISLYPVQAENNDRYFVCPGICRPVATVYIPQKWLEDPDSLVTSFRESNVPLTCSLASQMVNAAHHAHGHHRHNSNIFLYHVLQSIFWRRLMECYEHKVWRHAHQNSNTHVFLKMAQAMAVTRPAQKLHTRKSKPVDLRHLEFPLKFPVDALIIWIGSEATVDLINSQSQVLNPYPKLGANSVVGWAATDLIYPCSEGSTKCLGSNKHLRYIPGSAINFMPAGWACAQRRPLRTLAHTLLIYDPQFVVLADDDTFVNYPLLLTRYSRLLRQDMILSPIYLGEFTGATGPTGHLSTQGLFAGGSGYVLGRAVIDRLVDFQVSDGIYDDDGKPVQRPQDEFRSPAHYQYLSVAREGVAISQKTCSSKVFSTDLADEVFPTFRDKSLQLRRQAPSPSQNGCVITDKVTTEPTEMYVDNTNGMYLANRTMDPSYPYRKVVEGKYPTAVRLVDFCSSLMAHENTCQHRYRCAVSCSCRSCYNFLSTPVTATIH
jgi:hypothetical protein